MSTPITNGNEKKAIRLKRVSKKFDSKLAVDELSLEINTGSIYGLIGPNGAGKTTTFSMMSGFLMPTTGEIEVLGYSPKQVDALRSRFSVLPQDAILPPRDEVGELLMHLGKLQKISRDRLEPGAKAVLAEVGGADWWKVRCGTLSHGMAKRVQLAQALLGDPEVILLDEPTSGLDPRSAHEVRDIIRARKGRATIVVSSHNLQELEEVCDAAAILDRGRLVASGSMAELTGATHQVLFLIASARPGEPKYPVPIDELNALPLVTRSEFHEEERHLVVYFEPERGDAEDVIAQVIPFLYSKGLRLSGVSKGMGLEQRVMDLTES